MGATGSSVPCGDTGGHGVYCATWGAQGVGGVSRGGPQGVGGLSVPCGGPQNVSLLTGNKTGWSDSSHKTRAGIKGLTEQFLSRKNPHNPRNPGDTRTPPATRNAGSWALRQQPARAPHPRPPAVLRQSGPFTRPGPHAGSRSPCWAHPGRAGTCVWHLSPLPRQLLAVPRPNTDCTTPRDPAVSRPDHLRPKPCRPLLGHCLAGRGCHQRLGSAPGTAAREWRLEEPGHSLGPARLSAARGWQPPERDREGAQRGRLRGAGQHSAPPV